MDGRQDRAMTVEGGEKKVRGLKEINQQLQVEQNILQLQVDQVEKNVAKQENSVYNLERQRLELETVLYYFLLLIVLYLLQFIILRCITLAIK